MIVHGARHVSRALDLGLDEGHAGGGEEEGRGGRCAQVEVEAAVGADGDARGDGRAGCVVRGAGVEFLRRGGISERFEVQCAAEYTLQKSILFTPLDPSAGPTGGLGLACPAPTISLTIWSLASAFFAMVVVVDRDWARC